MYAGGECCLCTFANMLTGDDDEISTNMLTGDDDEIFTNMLIGDDEICCLYVNW
jgi:hypothetical protein